MFMLLLAGLLLPGQKEQPELHGLPRPQGVRGRRFNHEGTDDEQSSSVSFS